MPAQILIVDDEEAICWGLKQALLQEGYRAEAVSTAEAALEIMRSRPPDLVAMDVRLPGMDGLSALQKIREAGGELPVIIMTAFGNLRTALEAVRTGAAEYLTKPFDLSQFLDVVQRALRKPKRAVATADDQSADAIQADGILGQSPAMQEVFKRIALVVGTELPVLITGESGTGKELVARAIHRHSTRADKPFVAVHLAALSPTLIESELFGHVKGSFTGADFSRQGLLELAHEATLFFDEAGDIPPHVQVKLLRVLEQREVSPVGDVKARPADFRLIAATNRNLDAALTDGSFRQDFYYRIAGLDIRLPPLRERKEDIPLLANHFLQGARVPLTAQAGFSQEAMEELCRRAWPGNIRELRNAVEHAALLARGGVIEASHLPPARLLAENGAKGERALVEAIKAWTLNRVANSENAGHLYEQFLAEVEPALFDTILSQTNGNRTAAAELLGIDRATLRRRLT